MAMVTVITMAVEERGGSGSQTGLKFASSDVSQGRASLPAGHGEHVAPAASVYVIIDEPW